MFGKTEVVEVDLSEAKVGEVYRIGDKYVRVVDGPSFADALLAQFLGLVQPPKPHYTQECEVCDCEADTCELDSQETVERNIEDIMCSLVGDVVRNKEYGSDHLVGAFKVTESLGPQVFILCEGWKTFDQLSEEYALFDDEGNEAYLE